MLKMVWRILTSVALCGVVACGSMPNQGVEVGNPDLAGKKITIGITGSAEFYVVSFDAAVQATVTQIKNGEYQSQLGSFTIEQLVVVVTSLFNDGTLLNTNLLFDENKSISSVEVSLNEQLIASTFEVESSELICLSDSGNAAITLAQALCSRVVACNSGFECNDCELNVLQVPGLAAQFGDNGNSTLNESAQGVANNQVMVDETNFQACLVDINAIPCALVVERFNDQAAPNYNEIKELIPKPSCARGVLFDPSN